MKHFTIENETSNNIVHHSAETAGAVPNAELFNSENALAKIAGGWPASRLIDIWNSLPGITSVTKFKDRNTGVARIWKAIQKLGAAEGEAVAEANEPAATESAQPERPALFTATDFAPQDAHAAGFRSKLR